MIKLSLSRLLTKKTSETIFAVGALLMILSVINYIGVRYGGDGSEVEVISSNTQRNLSIMSAIKNGETTYEYTTGFIPGIGDVSSVKLDSDNPNNSEIK